MKAVCAIVAVCILAMGNLGAPGIDEIPEPDRNFAAVVVDKAMISTHLEKVSFDGNTVFVGYRGKGEVSISFDRVKHAAFEKSDEPSYQLVRITLTDDRVVEIKMKNVLTLFGMSELGPFRIKVKDISSISFIGEKTEPKKEGRKGESK